MAESIQQSSVPRLYIIRNVHGGYDNSALWGYYQSHRRIAMHNALGPYSSSALCSVRIPSKLYSTSKGN